MQATVGDREGVDRVEIFYKRQWATVFDDKWDIREAKVAS